MPKFNHEDLEAVLNVIYRKGIIAAVDGESDTAAVDVFGGQPGLNVPIYYHCTPDSELRSNGAIGGAASGFAVNDQVIVMCDTNGVPLRIIGFVNGIKNCSSLFWAYSIGDLNWDTYNYCGPTLLPSPTYTVTHLEDILDEEDPTTEIVHNNAQLIFSEDYQITKGFRYIVVYPGGDPACISGQGSVDPRPEDFFEMEVYYLKRVPENALPADTLWLNNIAKSDEHDPDAVMIPGWGNEAPDAYYYFNEVNFNVKGVIAPESNLTDGYGYLSIPYMTEMGYGVISLFLWLYDPDEIIPASPYPIVTKGIMTGWLVGAGNHSIRIWEWDNSIPEKDDHDNYTRARLRYDYFRIVSNVEAWGGYRLYSCSNTKLCGGAHDYPTYSPYTVDIEVNSISLRLVPNE